MKTEIYPIPRSCRKGTGKFHVKKLQYLLLQDKLSPHLKARVKKFIQAFANSHFVKLKQSLLCDQNEQGSIIIKSSLNGIPTQGFKIHVSKDNITLNYSDDAGLFYGIDALEQLLTNSNQYLQTQIISDYPDFPVRGYMLDVSRCKVPTLKSIFALIDILASFRINQLQFYTEHTFAFKEHKRVWDKYSPLTPEDISKIDKYCRDREIELVPNFNSFGHWDRWLRHPEYRKYAECPDGYYHEIHKFTREFGSTLVPENKSIQLLETLFDEFLPNFSSNNFNVGCDETWELGQGKSKSKAKKLGKTRVYLDFLLKIHKVVNKRKHNMMFWGDIILREPKLIKELPKNIIALNWGYEARHPFNKECPLFKESEIPYYVCPGTSTWNSLVGRHSIAQENLLNAARNGLKHGASGYLITDWGDNGHHQTLAISYPGIVTGACYSWALQENRKLNVSDAINKRIFHDRTNKTAKLLLAMGQVQDLFPLKTFNSSPFNLLLFENPDHILAKQSLLKKLDENILKRFDNEFAKISSQIPKCKPECADASLLIEEFKHSITMARFGIKKGLLQLGVLQSSQKMKEELRTIISQHKKIWLKRNRPGGLQESSKALKNVFRFRSH